MQCGGRGRIDALHDGSGGMRKGGVWDCARGRVREGWIWGGQVDGTGLGHTV